MIWGHRPEMPMPTRQRIRCLLYLLALSQLPLGHPARAAHPPPLVSKGGAVAADHPLASQAGAAMLRLRAGLRLETLSLYRRALRAARLCPDGQHRFTYEVYARNSFRESTQEKDARRIGRCVAARPGRIRGSD